MKPHPVNRINTRRPSWSGGRRVALLRTACLRHGFANLAISIISTRGAQPSARPTKFDIPAIFTISALKSRQNLPILSCRKSAPGGRKRPEGKIGRRLIMVCLTAGMS